MGATTTLSALDILNLMQGISATNLGYLTLCVSVILATGGITAGFYYLFNFKPLQKSIEKQEGELQEIKKELEKKSATLNTEFVELVASQTQKLEKNIEDTKVSLGTLKKETFDKIGLAEKQTNDFILKATKDVDSLKKQYQHIVLDSLWKEQYMWAGNEIWGNCLTTLAEYMEKAFDFKIVYLLDLWLQRVEDILKRTPEYNFDDKQQTKDRFLTLLGKIEGRDKQKEGIKILLNKLFS